MITKINHEIREELSLNIHEYCTADIIQQTQKQMPNFESCRSRLDFSLSYFWQVLDTLKKLELITISPKSCNLKVTEKWREAVKHKPKERKGDPLSHFLREEVEARKEGYFWKGWQDYKHADEILAQIRFKIQSKKDQRRDISLIADDDVKHSLIIILDSLPHNKFWKNKWDVAKLNANLNSICDAIREQSKGKVIDNVISIQSALEDFEPTTNFD